MISTGLADLDLVLGGGLPLGCLLLLLEPDGTSLHLPFLQYFLAQGVASEQDALWLQPDTPGLSTSLPKLSSDQRSSKVWCLMTMIATMLTAMLLVHASAPATLHLISCRNGLD